MRTKEDTDQYGRTCQQIVRFCVQIVVAAPQSVTVQAHSVSEGAPSLSNMFTLPRCDQFEPESPTLRSPQVDYCNYARLFHSSSLMMYGITYRDRPKYISHAVILGTRYDMFLLGVIKLFVLTDISSFQYR